MSLTDDRRSTRSHPPMGQQLRARRNAQGLSLRELAERAHVSASLISQIETGRAQPSVNTLYALADELHISVDELLFPGSDRAGTAELARTESAGPVSAASTAGSATASAPRPSGGSVQRADSRKRIRLASGVVWERLTAATEIGTEFLHVTYEVGGASSPENEFQRHGGHEWGVVIQGRLHVAIGFEEVELGPGDAISIDSSTPHRLSNRGDEPVHAVWFVLGRHSHDLSPSGTARGHRDDRGPVPD